jgi:hypothetical protein
MAINPRPKLGNLKLYETKQRSRKRSRASPCQIAALRLHDLARLFRARYGVTLPDDDAGRDDMLVAVNHCASLAHPLGKIDKWLGLWCPWLTLAERDAIATQAIIHTTHWTADQLAWRLRLIDKDRTALGITTIGAIDCSKRERTKRRKARIAANAKAWRARRKTANTA